MSDFKFKKKYGQNFLVDKNIVSKIVEDIDILPDALAIEIGCGDGRLTSKLCEKFDYVLGYEIDEEVKEELFSNLSDYSNFSIIFDDFLKRDISADIGDYSNIYIIANLPYYITTPIIEKLTDSNINFNLMRLMVQKEVGERFSAKVGTKNYGSITVYLNYNYEIRKNFIVSRNSFYPKPNVDSMIITLISKEKCLVKNEDIFYKLIRDSFRYKRKTLKNNLKEYNLDVVEKVLKKYGFDLSVRAENLDVKVFCDIANSL